MSQKDLHRLGRLCASLSTDYPKGELATLLGIPSPEKRQKDLQYITSIFVSSGFNLNAAYFLPSELIKAEDTIIDKPLDVEHDESKVVGHLYSKVFAYKDGSVFDPIELQDTVGQDVEKVSMDVVTAARIYKARFPEVAIDVESGKYGVSMECFYRDYDIIVDGIIIPKLEATTLGLTKAVNSVVDVVEGAATRGKHRIGRVLRSILFSGCGLVENPAGPDSVILETASQIDNNFVLDLTKVDSYMKAKQEDNTLVIHSLKGIDKDIAYLSSAYGGSHRHEVPLDKEETFLDGSHTHIVMPDKIPSGTYLYFSDDGSHRHPYNNKSALIGAEKSHTHKVYVDYKGGYYVTESSAASTSHTHELVSLDVSYIGIEDRYDLDEEKKLTKGENMGETSYSGVHYHTVVLKDGTKLKTIVPADILKSSASEGEEKDKDDKNESAGTGNVDGRSLSSPDICVSFKRYIYERAPGDNPGTYETVDATPGLVSRVESYPAPTGGVTAGDSVGPGDKIKHENWCALFDSACPTPGGQATHPDCFRMVLDRTTKETISNYYEQLQENRKNAWIKKAFQSLLETVEKARKCIEETDV